MKRIIALCLAAGFVLAAGCAAPAAEQTPQPTETPVETAEPAATQTPAATQNPNTVIINGVEYERDGWGVKEPESDVDLATSKISDFCDSFSGVYETERTTRTILTGTDMETEVTVLKGKEEGPTVYIVSGVHGDERAGWFTGTMLKSIDIKAGTLHIIAPVNRWGAEAHTRYIEDGVDLNRSFPGTPDGNMGERMAAALMADIAEVNPVFLFDLHEARSTGERADFLGSSLIYTSLEGISDMFLDLIFATQTGELCSEPFSYNAPGPNGSINSTVTNELHIPTVTVETFRGYQMSRRISDQLQIFEYVLHYYGLV